MRIHNAFIKAGVAVGLLLLLAGSALRAETPATQSSSAKLTKVACVGDSITYGSRIEDRAHDSYPAQLGRMLGDQYNVRNFGVSGATLLKKGDRPYNKTKEYQPALDFAADIVVIMLGTNDSKPQNISHKDEFVADYD
ncbi:MAG TPA: GDSL-type esterase/lipase family protein, partial [Tepidisphaeraceae bacterium]|nr:GDSL-type esterase/lipase family protein [Tepidisphaeraceae bacterium]